MRAKSLSAKSTADLATALAMNLEDGFAPTIAIVFISIKQDRDAVSELLHQHNIDIVGATSSGEFIDGHEDEGSISVLLLDLDRSHYSILFESIGDRAIEDVGNQVGQRALATFKHPAFILCSTLITADGRMLEGEPLLRSIEKEVGSKLTLFGGMAGDDITFTGSYVFTNKQSTDYGVVALVLNEEKVALHGMAISGWKPLGISRKITHSDGNLIYTIDDQPALEMYLRFLGSNYTKSSEQMEFFDSVGIHYPLQIERADREPMMCSPVGYDKEKEALICEANVIEGSTFRFSTPPDFDIIETVIEKAVALKQEKNATADALLIFSCAGRLKALGPLAHQENEGLCEVWNAPMAGFYTYGEYGRAINGKHELHSTTCSWVALQEK